MAEIALPTKATQDDTNTKVTSMNANVGTPASTANNAPSSNVHAKINWLVNNVNTLIAGRTVKSVQRGIVKLNAEGNTTITISSVNPSKCHVELYGTFGATTAGYDRTLRIGSMSATSITLSPTGNPTEIGWEVIEFY